MRSTVKFADLVALPDCNRDRAEAIYNVFPFGSKLDKDNRHMPGPERNKLIRAAIKEAAAAGTIPHGVTVSVRTPHHGSLIIEVQAAPFLILNPEYVRWQADNPHSFPGSYDAPYIARDMRTPSADTLLKVLEAIASQWRYDNSDTMTDYFDTNMYLDVRFAWEMEKAHREWILSVPRNVTIKPKTVAGKPARVAPKPAASCSVAAAPVISEAIPSPLPSCAAAPLRIESFSDRSIIIKGETREHMERIKSAVNGLAPFWHRKATGWLFPTSREEEVRASLADLLSACPTSPADPDGGPDGGKRSEIGECIPPGAIAAAHAAPPPEVFGRDAATPSRGFSESVAEPAPNKAAKLIAVAERMEARAEESLSRDRLANTPRRARMAASAEAEASAQLAMARTIRAIAEAQHDGTAGPLDRLSTAKQAELLAWILRRAVYAADRNLPYRDQEARKGRTASESDLPYVEFPTGDDGHRLRAMGILTTTQLREAARRFAELSTPSTSADPVKAAIRALCGRKLPGYFPTPADLARRVVTLLRLQPGHSVLEPSAGSGNIADAMAEIVGKDAVTVVEMQGALRAILEAKGYTLSGCDFFDHDGRYDRIGMNPPFEQMADVDHVRRAFGMLNPGGRLVSIMCESPFFRQDRKAVEFREWLDSVGGWSEQLPAGSFTESGTGVATRLVVIDA